MSAGSAAPAADVWVDGRSARSGRLTGWERFAKELVPRLATRPGVWPELELEGDSVPDRLRADWSGLPRRMRAVPDARWIFPTMPPSPRADQQRVTWILYDLTWLRHPRWASRLGRHYYAPLARHALRHVRHVVTISESVRTELLAEGVPSERLHVVHPGLTELPRDGLPPTGFDEHTDYVLAVGSVEPRKNLDLLAEVWATTSLGRDVALVVAGRTAWGSVPAGVRLVSQPSDDALSWLYRHAAAVVLPSHYEGFGLPLIEAAAVGTPIACSDIPVFREVTGGAAHFFPPADAGAAHAAIRLALAEGRRVRRWPHSWDEAADTLLRICRSDGGR